MANVLDLIANKIGARVNYYKNQYASSAGSTISQIVKDDPNRLALMVINLGSYDLFLAPDPQVSATRGIFVASAGGSWGVEWQEDYILPILGWYAYAADTTDLLIIELIISGEVPKP